VSRLHEQRAAAAPFQTMRGSIFESALAAVQRDWLVKLRKEKGLAQSINLAGPFIMNSQGKL